MSETNNAPAVESTNVEPTAAAVEPTTVEPTTQITDLDTSESVVDAPPSLQEREDKFNADIEAKTIVESLAESMETFTIEKMMEVLPELMRHVQVYKNLNGAQKKKLVIKMINHLVDITDSPGDDEIWDPILKRMVPSIIDTLVKVDKKKLVLRKKPKFLSRLFLCM